MKPSQKSRCSAPSVETDEATRLDETNHSEAKPRPVFRWFIRLSVVFGLIFAAILAFAWYAYQAAQVVPDYYQVLLEQPIEKLAAAGDEFEIEVLELQNSAIETGDWHASFSQDQINGWLASDLPKKFPGSIPASVTQPRVALAMDELKLMFHFESQRFTGIVEVSGDAYCTENLNEVAIRINYIKSGLLSLPIKPWTEKISKILQRNEFPVSWTEDDGDMIALFSLPHKLSDQKDQKRIIESIEILDGQLKLQGITLAPEDLEAYQESSNPNPVPNPSQDQ